MDISPGNIRQNKTLSLRIATMLVILSVIFPMGSSALANSTQSSTAAPYHIVELKGIEIPDLLNKAFDQLTLFSVKQGILIPIPFQMEDYDAEGYSWFEESGNQFLGSEEIFDEHDSLFFRYADSGNKLDDYNASFAQITAEIAVTSSETGETRYVYVSDKLNGFVHKPLTTYDQASGVIESDYFRLKTNPQNFLIWNDFTYRTYEGERAETLLDTLKIRMDAGVILEGARITLDNRNIKTKIAAIKQGPIRTVILGSAYLTFAKIPVVFLELNFQIYPQQYRIDAKVHVPLILAQVLSTPSATISLDGNNLKGSLLQVSAGSQNPVEVDGSMSEAEIALQGTPLPRENNWIWLTTQKGFDVIAQLFIPDNFQVPISVHYIDNEKLKDKPERFKGQGPNVGYHIHNIPIDDTFHFGFSAFFADTIHPQKPEDFMKSIARVPFAASTGAVKPTQLAQQ